MTRSGDELRSTVTDLNHRLEPALEQLHGVEKLVAMAKQAMVFHASTPPASARSPAR